MRSSRPHTLATPSAAACHRPDRRQQGTTSTPSSSGSGARTRRSDLPRPAPQMETGHRRRLVTPPCASPINATGIGELTPRLTPAEGRHDLPTRYRRCERPTRLESHAPLSNIATACVPDPPIWCRDRRMVASPVMHADQGDRRPGCRRSAPGRRCGRLVFARSRRGRGGWPGRVGFAGASEPGVSGGSRGVSPWTWPRPGIRG